MEDLAVVGLTLLFFGLMLFYAVAVDNLLEKGR